MKTKLEVNTKNKDKLADFKVGVDNVIFSVDTQGDRLLVLLRKRTEEPFINYWSLPGTLVRQGESLQDYYNLGNALAQAGELEQALQSYKQALTYEPEDADTLYNKSIVEQALQQQQQQNQDSQENQENQDSQDSEQNQQDQQDQQQQQSSEQEKQEQQQQAQQDQ